MQWILQKFEDTEKLAQALDDLGYSYSFHKVVPFVGDLSPAPTILDPTRVLFFGSYALWRYAEAHGLSPGVFRVRPFIDEAPWHPYLLNGKDAHRLSLGDVPDALPQGDRAWFIRPVSDNKELPGSVKSADAIHEIAEKVLALDPTDIPDGALRHDTELMLSAPANILKEWRLWIVEDQVVTYSLYKEGAHVTYRPEIDKDALAFAGQLTRLNAGYAQAYVMDLCRTTDGLHLLETNCINAAGFYAADLALLAARLNTLKPRQTT